jgi:hypothetical protein
MNSTFGDPAAARSGRGQAGLDSSVVRSRRERSARLVLVQRHDPALRSMERKRVRPRTEPILAFGEPELIIRLG